VGANQTPKSLPVHGIFDRINWLYERHLKILSAKPAKALKDKIWASAFRRWAEEERLAWTQAINSDPLLPERLLPQRYLGRRAWQQRINVLGKARRDLENLSHRPAIFCKLVTTFCPIWTKDRADVTRQMPALGRTAGRPPSAHSPNRPSPHRRSCQCQYMTGCVSLRD
jgi:hypothetical protein